MMGHMYERDIAVPEVREFSAIEDAAAAAAQEIATAMNAAVDRAGRASLMLTGGSTPRPLYNRLAGMRPPLPWRRIHLFWGDERCVPPTDPASNYRLARETLIDGAAVPEANVHRIRGELAPVDEANRFHSELRAFFGSAGLPVFDCVLLGMGPDGHVASLFPGEKLLDAKEWVAVAAGDQASPPVPRVTVTLPVINAASLVLMLVSGDAKRRVLDKVLDSPSGVGNRYPVARVRPGSGRMIWFVGG